MRLRVHHKLFLSYLVLISLVVAALSFGADSLLRRHLVQLVERDLRRELRLDTRLYDSLRDLDPDSIADLLGALNGHRVTIIRQDGVVVGESSLDGEALARMENHLHRPEVQEVLRGAAAEASRHSRTLDTDQLYMAARSRRGEIVRAALPLSEIDEAVGRVQRGILGVGALAIVLAGLFSLGFSILVTRPLRRLRTAAAAMAGGDLGVRLHADRRDELGDLARGLDALAGELQRRLAQLESERAETETLIDSMSEGVLALSADGTVRRANPAAREMFSLREGWQARGGLFQPGAAESVSRRPDFLALVRRALQGEAIDATELVSDGRSLLATAQPLPEGGAVVVILDVSELRRLEGIRRDFVANASHELKTPLTAIRGYSETLGDPDLEPEQARRFAAVVHANAERLQHIVDDLLDLTRIESGAWPIEREEISLADLAEEVWAGQGKRAGEQGPRLVLDLAPGAERVRADPEALRQILTNLISNALRYTPPDGSVTLASRPANGRIEIEVRDTGSGIEAAHLPRLFERFYRADPARSRDRGGTGLGLSIVKHLVEAHGGTVSAESRVGVGTTIRFTLAALLLLLLPLVLPSVVAAQGPTPLPSRRGVQIGGRIQEVFNTTSVDSLAPGEWTLRRVRLSARFRLGRIVSGRVQPDYSGGEFSFKDAYLQFEAGPGLRLLVGQSHRPFSPVARSNEVRVPVVEKTAKIRGARTLDAQAVIQSLGYSSRDVGVQLLGALGVPHLPLQYELALSRGPLDMWEPGLHPVQLGARLSASVAPGLRVGTAWSRRAFAAGAGAVGGGTRELRAGDAFDADVEYGDFEGGPHLIGEVVTGVLDPYLARRFHTGQLIASYRFNPHGPIVTGVEPGLRASSSHIRGGAGEGGVLLTPAISAYVHGESRLTLNYSEWRPRSGAHTEHDWKLLFQLAF